MELTAASNFEESVTAQDQSSADNFIQVLKEHIKILTFIIVQVMHTL